MIENNWQLSYIACTDLPHFTLLHSAKHCGECEVYWSKNTVDLTLIHILSVYVLQFREIQQICKCEGKVSMDPFDQPVSPWNISSCLVQSWSEFPHPVAMPPYRVDCTSSVILLDTKRCVVDDASHKLRHNFTTAAASLPTQLRKQLTRVGGTDCTSSPERHWRTMQRCVTQCYSRCSSSYICDVSLNPVKSNGW